MGLRQVLSAAHTISGGGSSISSREESTESPEQYETSTENLPDKVHYEVQGGFVQIQKLM
jgi:hypothetical protein